MNPLFINKGKWESFTDSEMQSYVQEVFNYYREKGFPYFPTDKNFRDNEFRKLIEYDGDILNEGVLKQTMHGLSLSWSYMPHSWSIRCNGMKTPLEVFNDDELFLKVIKKRIAMGDNISDNGIRKMLKMFTGTQSVSNFRPTSSSDIYRYFLPEGGKILDMSSGFGGRLLGYIRQNSRSRFNYSYVGYEPSLKTNEGLHKIKNDYGLGMDISIKLLGSEFISEKDYFDFAFTSPPYFNTEEYSYEETQSFVKYPTKELWMKSFMFETLTRTYDSLKKDSYMLLNVADVKTYPNLCEDIKKTAKLCGFDFKYEIKLALSNSNFKNKKSAYKYEPVYVFKK